uniref:Uncharacterized protein n=1 Tax=Candidatus Kentrum sp. FW TaxID=2126338 RepID=A0A450T7I3_9GAMM|nr:MAG: hypothetical protein BECKFW1821B_GA0114236_10749 [Candidatus Kentron sp. FW]
MAWLTCAAEIRDTVGNALARVPYSMENHSPNRINYALSV